MKILLVSHEFFLDGASHHGGIATYTKTIAQLLKKYGHQVCVATLSYDLNDTVWWEGIRVERIRVPAYAYKLKNVLHSKVGEYLLGAWLIRQRIRRLSKTWRPDLVHYANFKSVGFFRTNRIPAIVRLSSDNVLWREAHKKDYRIENAYSRMTLEDRMELFTVKHADSVFAPSNFVAELTARRLKIPVRVIESPVSDNVEELPAAELPEVLQRQRYVLYFGALSRAKGTHLFLPIMKDILKECPDCLFVFIGHDYGMRTGPVKQLFADCLKESAGRFGDRVLYMDFQSPHLLRPIIRQAACCVFPSRVDNLPNTCLEAMSLEVPVIGTKGASFEQLIHDGVSGLLIEIDNADQLRNAVMQVLLMSEEDRAKMGAQAKMRVERNNGFTIAKELTAFYQEVVNQHEQK